MVEQVDKSWQEYVFKTEKIKNKNKKIKKKNKKRDLARVNASLMEYRFILASLPTISF